MRNIPNQKILDGSDASTHHPAYDEAIQDWKRIRDTIQGESKIKSKKEVYLPRPAGMSGEYASAYDDYITRAHFPLIGSYALAGALGIIINKLPEFNVPPQLAYIQENATKDGRDLKSLFLDVIIEILETGRCPLMVDIIPDKNEFRFVQYTAEDFINWKTEVIGNEKNLILAVLEEALPESEDIFSHDSETIQRVLLLNSKGKYVVKVFGPDGEYKELSSNPSFMGKTINEVPLFIAGSINNSYELQTIPLLAVANASIQIYRKEADLANSEFLSCNPTLILSGVANDENLPNVVGSSVMISLPDAQARAYYTKTDTQALQHVRDHINDLYEEAIRHGIAILDVRKGVESAESLRIRQATQSASIYSIFLSAVTAIESGLKLMSNWAGYDTKKVVVDAPSQLTYGIPESAVIKEIVAGFETGVIPIEVVHRYLVGNGMLDQTIGLKDYETLLKNSAKLKNQFKMTTNSNIPPDVITGGEGQVSGN